MGAPEEVKQEAAAAKAAFLSHITGDRGEPVEVEGCTVQAIGDEGYSRVRALRDQAAGKAKSDERLAAYNNAERAAFLAEGVTTPKMAFPEWLHVLKTAQPGKIDSIINTIKDISGIDDLEVMLTKKAFGQIRELTES